VVENERLKLHAQDGRIFLVRSKATYDAVFLDAYRGPFVPFHLLTKEYFELIKKRLKPGGVVAQNVEPSTMVLDSAIKTIGTVFSNVDTYEAGGNVVIIAYDGERVPLPWRGCAPAAPRSALATSCATLWKGCCGRKRTSRCSRGPSCSPMISRQ
jgi:spermidine synthase